MAKTGKRRTRSFDSANEFMTSLLQFFSLSNISHVYSLSHMFIVYAINSKVVRSKTRNRIKRRGVDGPRRPWRSCVVVVVVRRFRGEKKLTDSTGYWWKKNRTTKRT